MAGEARPYGQIALQLAQPAWEFDANRIYFDTISVVSISLPLVTDQFNEPD
jgi:hypothetical protein